MHRYDQRWENPSLASEQTSDRLCNIFLKECTEVKATLTEASFFCIYFLIIFLYISEICLGTVCDWFFWFSPGFYMDSHTLCLVIVLLLKNTSDTVIVIK